MKLPRSKFWGAVGLSFVTLINILTISAVWFKTQLTSDELHFISHLLRLFVGPIVILSLLLAAVCIWAVEALYRNYSRPIRKITEKVSLINTTNPSYRVPGEGAGEIRLLCDRINEAAQRHENPRSLRQRQSPVVCRQHAMDFSGVKRCLLQSPTLLPEFRVHFGVIPWCC